MAEKRVEGTGDELEAIIAEFLPTIRTLASGRYAISIAGSLGKGRSDPLSDIDFRLICDAVIPDAAEEARLQSAIDEGVARWQARGRRVDGCWIRRVADVERALDRWVSGRPEPEEIVWTIWGYHLPTDLMNQHVLEDPHGLIAGWRARLTPYPPALKAALLEKHLEILRYWRDDYHYESKVRRGDVVFLAGLTSKLVHSLLQVLYALNETYYPGDGHNLSYLSGFRVVPPGFEEEVRRVLYPEPTDRMLEEQRERLLRLIADVEDLLP